MKKELTKKELEKITTIMNQLEAEAYEPFKNDGFSEATMFDYDNDYIDIELTFGNQSDVYINQFIINRDTMELEQ